MFKILDVKDSVNQNGIGFGLTISKMIIEKLGGSLSIKSNKRVSIEDSAGLSVTLNFPDKAPARQIFEHSFREEELSNYSDKEESRKE